MSVLEALQHLADLQIKTGDTLHVLWETESWQQPYKQFWCEGVVVAQSKGKTYVFYGENELVQYYKRHHPPLYVLQDLSKIQWNRTLSNSNLFQQHKQLLQRFQTDHVITFFNLEK